MLNLQIYIFVSDPVTQEETQLIKIMTEAGYFPLIDAEHRCNYRWYMETFENTPCRLYCVELDQLLAYKIDDIGETLMTPPNFMIIYNADAEITENDWAVVGRYFEALIYALTPPRVTSRRCEQLLTPPAQNKVLDDAECASAGLITDREIEMDLDEYETPEDYSFDCEEIKDRDIMIASIEKPYTDLPFTLVIREFSVKGYLPLFSGVFMSKAWGVCSADIAFLKQLWDHLQMEGEFVMEKIMQEAVDRCLPSETHVPEPEPELYRKNIQQVRETLANKESKQFIL